jgi:hypothetical protein
LADFALPLHVVDKLMKKCSYVGTPLNYGKKVKKVNPHFYQNNLAMRNDGLQSDGNSKPIAF